MDPNHIIFSEENIFSALSDLVRIFFKKKKKKEDIHQNVAAPPRPTTILCRAVTILWGTIHSTTYAKVLDTENKNHTIQTS